jgi:EAL domain-containing protein (putative c-di-GMP-specific phosphodiesterase class I)
MQIQSNQRMQIGSELRHAIKEAQFKVFYQPIINLQTNQIVKCEALIRWDHPTLGLIAPDKFIPIAEETKQITEIGHWVFETVVQQLIAWRSTMTPDFQISINTSPIQFLSENHTTQAWKDYMHARGLDGSAIIIEITEGLILEANALVNAKLLELRDAGIQVALDDFGTGYSSLSYLQTFDIDYIKIDKRFIMNLSLESKNLPLCKAIISMAHELNMKVIAEGVETKEQNEILKCIGCDFAQGYFFSKPVNSNDFQHLLMNKLK